MSQILDLISFAPAVLIAAATWALLVVATTLVATFHPAPARQDAALRVLDRLLRCPPGRSDR